MDIRAATIADSDVIKNIHLNAFPESESALVSKVAVDLLNIPTRPKVMHWVAEVDDVVLRPALYGPKTADLYQFNLGRSVFTVINYYGTKSGIHSESSWRLAAIWLKRVKGGVLRGPKEAP